METRTVLFVDDDAAVLKDLEMSLKDEAYDTCFAETGDEAIQILQRQDVHVIVVDMVMPHMDGFELLRVVRKDYPEIVTVVLSGYAQTSDVRKAMLELDVQTYIAKPWMFDENFKSVVRQAVDDHNLQSDKHVVAQ